MTVAVDRDRCIGSGMCVMAVPGVFDQADDGTVVLRTPNPDGADVPGVRRAVAHCPSGALRLLDELPAAAG